MHRIALIFPSLSLSPTTPCENASNTKLGVETPPPPPWMLYWGAKGNVRTHAKKKKKKQDPSIHGATKCPPYCSATTTKGDWSWALVDSLSSRYRSTDQSVDSITGRIRFNFTGSFLPPLLLPFHIRGFSIGLVWPRSMSGSPVIASATLTRPNPTQLTDSLSRPIFSSYIVENALGFLVICTQQC